MTFEDTERLIVRQTRIRHCDGPEGLYLGCWYSGQGLVLTVESAAGVTHQWWADDCEVAS